jgi:hypothetical protein
MAWIMKTAVMVNSILSGIGGVTLILGSPCKTMQVFFYQPVSPQDCKACVLFGKSNEPRK